MEEVIEFDSEGQLVYMKDSDGLEEWWEHDSKGRVIHYKNSEGEDYHCDYEIWINGIRNF
jgi:hypothetical protein